MRNTVTLVVSALTAILLGGCSITIPPLPTPTPTPVPAPTNTVVVLPNNPALLKPQLVGYGAVNEWINFADSDIQKMVDIIATSGCNDGSPIQPVRPAYGDPIGLFATDQTHTKRSKVAWSTYLGK